MNMIIVQRIGHLHLGFGESRLKIIIEIKLESVYNRTLIPAVVTFTIQLLIFKPIRKEKFLSREEIIVVAITINVLQAHTQAGFMLHLV